MESAVSIQEREELVVLGGGRIMPRQAGFTQARWNKKKTISPE
jgi:hypothetical protein